MLNIAFETMSIVMVSAHEQREAFQAVVLPGLKHIALASIAHNSPSTFDQAIETLAGEHCRPSNYCFGILLRI
jgi:hypothetical protein